MIVPLGHDTDKLRRRPLVSWALLGLCGAVFLATTGLSDPIGDAADAQLDAAFSYWREHPDLEPPELLVRAHGDPGHDARGAFARQLDQAGAAPVAPDELARQQARLDAMVAQAAETLEDHVFFRFGLNPADPRLAGLFGHLFLHGGFLHLIGNLLFLGLTGPFIEDRYGRALFAVFYLASGIAGAAVFVQHAPGFDAPLIGASGAIAGVMGAFLVRFATARIRFGYWLGFFFGTFRAPAFLILPLWFLGELFSAKLVSTGGGTSGGVAYWAHVGGFGFGVIVAGIIRATGLDRVPGDGEAGGLDGFPADAEAGPENDFGAEEHALHAQGSTARRDAGLEGFREACQAEASPRLEPETGLRLAGFLRAEGRTGEASLALHAALHDAQPEQAMRIARAARGFDPVVALRACERLAEVALSETDRTFVCSLGEQADREARARGIIVVPSAFVPAALHGRAAAEPPFAPATLDPHEVELPLDDATRPVRRLEPGEPISFAAEPDPVAGARHGPPGTGSDRPLPDTRPILDSEPPALAPEALANASTQLFERKPEPDPVARLRRIEARPLTLEADALWLEVDGRGRSRLALSRVTGVSLAGVRGIGRPKPGSSEPRALVLLDLVLAPADAARSTRLVVRLRSDRFDPRALAPEGGTPLESLRALARALRTRARAAALTPPAIDPAGELPVFADLASYETEVLSGSRA